jgi:multicomponent Na+:H+ antiporter subunit D
MFFIAALSMVGIPPLSGFLGKVFTTQGAFEAGYYWLGGIGLLASLFILFSMIKLFMKAFWGETILSTEEEKGITKGLLLPIALLTLVSIAMGVGAEAITGYVAQAAEELLDPSLYIQAVFK